MSVYEIINELTALAYRLDSMRRHQATTEWLKTTGVLREAADLIRTYLDANPNDPLTLEELRKMDGEPVWVHSLDGDGKDTWAFVDTGCEVVRIFVTRFSVKCMGTLRHFKTYGKTWIAYRRRPEEEQNA